MPIGEIYADNIVRQRFFCDSDQLARVQVMLATYNRLNKGIMIFNLIDSEGNVVANDSVDMSMVKDNSFHSFRFDPILKSKNNYYTVVLKSLDARPGTAITAWISDNDSDNFRELNFGSKEIRGFLMMRLGYKVKAN